MPDVHEEPSAGMVELPPISNTVARLSVLAQSSGAKAYLEIGVAKGGTFLHTTFFEVRHGVDPLFRFDTGPHESESVRFFAVKSDEFFVHHADPQQKYDIIFLDGRHTFEQTFRDFCCSQAHAHDGTIWLIDDVHPSDIFSAFPDPRTANRHRESHGLPGKDWMGDVFKVVFAIHDFFPNLSYRTVIGRGRPQTVVIHRQRESFAPVFTGLEQISRMTYYDFIDHRERLNLASHGELLAWLKEAQRRAERKP
jgi:hypothetical protein